MKKRLLFLICFFVFFFLYSTASAKDQHQDTTKETIVFFPAEEMRSILGIEKEGIFVPYKEYKDLYKKAKTEYLKRTNETAVPVEIKEPSIIQANYSGTIKGDILILSADYKIAQNSEEPQVLDFPLEDVLFLSAKLNNEKALFYKKDGRHKIVIPKNGTYDLSIDFFVPIDFNEKKSIVSFNIPKAMLGDIKLTSDLFYDIRFPNALFSSKKQIKDKMEFIGFIGNRTTIDLEITNRRSSGEKNVKIFSNEQHSINIDHELIEHEAAYFLDIQNGKVNSFELSIGKGIHVHDISGSGISGWSRESKEGLDVLHVNSHIPLSGPTSFSVRTYQYADPQKSSLEISDIQIKDLFERKGILTVSYDENIRVNTDNVKFLLPLKDQLLPQEINNNLRIYKQYRIFNLPYEISFSLKEVPAQTTMQQYSKMNIAASKIDLSSQIILSALPQGTTQFVFSYPENYLLRDVFASINGETVKEDHDIKIEENILHINVRQPLSSNDIISFSLISEQFLNEESFKTRAQDVNIPAVTYSDAQKMTGNIEILIDELFLLEDITLKGYTPSETMISSSSADEKDKKLSYDLRSLSPQGSILLSLRKAEQTTKSVTYIAADENLLKTNAYIQYEITTGKKDSFYFAIPQWEDSKINIEGADIKEKKKVSPDKLKKELKASSLPDLKDHDIWNVVLQKEITGSYQLEIDYQKKIEKFNTLVDVPLIMPLDVLNDTGHIVLEASKNTEIVTEISGLNDIETYEIPKWPSYTPSNRIVESLRYFTRPFTFRTAITRRDESPVLASIAERETLSFAFDVDSAVFFEADYIIKNTNLQFLEIQLPSNFELWGATIQGKGIKPRKGENNLLLIPLPVDTSENINLRLTGQIPKKGIGNIWKSLTLNSPRLSIPSLQSNINVYFPKKYSLFNISSNFENFPQPDHQRPLLVTLYQNIFSSFFQNFGHMATPMRYMQRGLQGRLRSASDDIGDQFDHEAPRLGESVQYEPYYLSTDHNIVRDESTSQRYAEDISGIKAPAPKRQAGLQNNYKRKKGILSLNINIPKEGDSLSAYKLWGNSRLSLTFISESWKNSMVMFTAFLFVILGFYFKKNKTMTPFSFLITTSLLCTLIPIAIMRSLVFIFNGAILGAIIFIILLLLISLAKNIFEKLGFRFLVFITLISGILLSSHIALCEQATKPFPDIKVFFPYEDVTPTDLKGPEALFIPTGDYFSLKFLAQPPYKPEAVFKFDNEFNITGFKAEGLIEENRIKFSGSLDIFVNTEDWVLLELPFRSVYIEELLLDGKPIPVKTKLSYQELGNVYLQQVVAFNSKTLPPVKSDIYEIPVLGTGHHSIGLVFYVELESLPGKKTLDFGFPETLCSDLSFDLKSKDIFLEFENPENGFYIDDSGNSTKVKISLSQRSNIKVSWFPKKYLKKEEKPLIYTDNEVNIFMGYEEVLISQQTNIKVEKSSIASLSFQKDPKLEVIDVFSNKVKNWKVRKENEFEFLDITFKHEILNTVDILVKAKYSVIPDSTENITFFNPIDTQRIMGNLNIYAIEDYTLAIKNIKDLKISENKNQFRQEIPGFEFQKTYSFLNENFNADITRIPKERKFSADIKSFHEFSENILNSHYSINLSIKKGSISDIKIRIPKSSKISSLNASGASDYIIQDNILTIPFIRTINESYAFDMNLEEELASFDNASVESIELLGAENITGTSLMLFPRGFEVMEQAASGLRSTNLNTIDQYFETINPSSFGSKYAYTIRENSYQANYKITKEQPIIDVVKVYHSIVQDTLVNVKLLNIFNIKNAPVDHFDIIAPVDLKDSIIIKGDGIKTMLKKESDDGKNVYITVNTISKIDRSYILEISFNKYFSDEKTFEMPNITFPQASNRTEFISIESDTVYRVEPEIIQSLHETEPDMIPVLPAGIDLNNILWSYRASSSGTWKYSLRLKRLEREKMVKAKILREDIKTLVIPNGFALHEVNIKANNRSLQFLPVYLPTKAELWSLKVGNEPSRASLSKLTDNKKKEYLIPLIKSGAGDRSFDVKLIYITPIRKLGLFGKIDFGMIETGDISVEKTTWTLSVPDNYSYFQFKTNMDEIDLSMIEAEKTLELAKEYKYWTNLASYAKGDLQKQAVTNQAKVRRDYDSQFALNRSVQSRLSTRVGNNDFDQNLVQTAQTKNAQMANEASQIMNSNAPVSRTRQLAQQIEPEQSIKGRRNIKGWQFKTNDFRGESQVQESIDNYIGQEDTKLSMQAQQVENNELMDQQYNKHFSAKGQKIDRVKSISYKGKDSYDKNIERKSTRSSRERQVRSRASDAQRLDDRQIFANAVDKRSEEAIAMHGTAGGYVSQSNLESPQEALYFDGRGIYTKEESLNMAPAASSVQYEYWGGPSDDPSPTPQVATPQAIAPQKEIVQKKSALLKGLRSIDIPIPDQGRKFSFKKLGGNPTLAIHYRKKGVLSKIFLLMLCVAACFGSFKMRKYDLPLEKITSFFKNIKLKSIFNRILDSRAFVIITFIVMVVSLIVGSPLFAVTLGFVSIFYTRFVSAKRYAKIGYTPKRGIKQFFKDLPSNAILISLALSFFEIKFMIILGFATFVNFMLATIYAFCTLFVEAAKKEDPSAVNK